MRLRPAAFLLAAAAGALTLAGSATGLPPVNGGKVVRLNAPILALTIHGPNVAYYEGTSSADPKGKIANPSDKVVLWNSGSGRSTKLSGHQTGLMTTQSGGLAGFAIASDGSAVAWMMGEASNTSANERIFMSKLAKPREWHVANAQRNGNNPCAAPGPNCAGDWLGGLVATNTEILANVFTTDKAGDVTDGSLDKVAGRNDLKVVAGGTQLVTASAASGNRIAVLHDDGTVGVYTVTGKSVAQISPTPRAKAAALNGTNLLVLRFGGTIALYNATTGALKKTFVPQGDPTSIDNVELQGTVGVYTTGCAGGGYHACKSGSIRAFNITTGKDRLVGSLAGGITTGLVGIDKTGLVYAANGWGAFQYGKATLVFLPFARVAALVS